MTLEEIRNAEKASNNWLERTMLNYDEVFLTERYYEDKIEGEEK